MLKIFSTMTAIVLFALSISACQPTLSDDKQASEPLCQTQTSPFEYDVCHISGEALTENTYSLQLFWRDANNQPLLTFDSLLNDLPSNQTLAFAMNAGMYNDSFAPIGYTVIEGEEIKSLNLKEGGGNFHLLPNGVVWWDKAGKVQITESHVLSEQLDKGSAVPWFATQSGPMLVINNEIHPQFNPDSTSLKFRNGIGVCGDDNASTVQFVNSKQPVNFYQFAALFKENLGCSNALFLDGGVASSLYAPSIAKHDKKDMGVIIAVVNRAK